MNSTDGGEAAEIGGIIKDNFSEKGVERIKYVLKKYKVLDASFETAQAIIDEAKGELSLFPESQAKEALLASADYSLHREK